MLSTVWPGAWTREGSCVPPSTLPPFAALLSTKSAVVPSPPGFKSDITLVGDVKRQGPRQKWNSQEGKTGPRCQCLHRPGRHIQISTHPPILGGPLLQGTDSQTQQWLLSGAGTSRAQAQMSPLIPPRGSDEPPKLPWTWTWTPEASL